MKISDKNRILCYPMCVYSYLELLTRERIKTLKQWIDGVEETEACIGSVKTK